MLTGTQSSGNLSLTGIHRPNSGRFAIFFMHSIISLLPPVPQLIRHLFKAFHGILVRIFCWHWSSLRHFTKNPPLLFTVLMHTHISLSFAIYNLISHYKCIIPQLYHSVNYCWHRSAFIKVEIFSQKLTKRKSKHITQIACVYSYIDSLYQYE